MEQEVRWGYRFYLGREVESSAVIQFHADCAGDDPKSLPALLLDAPETQSRAAFAGTPHRFCSWRPGTLRIAVIGNCTATDLARVISAMSGVSVIGIAVWNLILARLNMDDVLTILEDADCIVSIALGPDFGALSTQSLRNRYGAKLAVHPAIHFEGLHPDITYLGARERRIVSLACDYHSRFVVRSVLAGDPIAHCQRFYRDGVLENIDNRFETSAQILMARDAETDLRIAGWFFDTIRDRPLLYSINHPTSIVLHELARLVCRHFDIAHKPVAPELLASDLIGNIIWPVHDYVAEALGLGYSTANAICIAGHMVDMDDFILRSYLLYAQQDPGLLAQAAAAHGLCPAADFATAKPQVEPMQAQYTNETSKG